MENKNCKNFTLNMLFLTFKDKVTANIYYRSVYSFWQMLVASLVTYALVIINMTLLHLIEDNQNKTGIKQLQVMLVVIEGLLMISFITWKVVTHRQRNETYFYPVYTLISAMNIFNLYLQPFMTIEAITNSSNALITRAIYPLIQFFSILVFLFFIENNFIIYSTSFTLTLVFLFYFSISLNWNLSSLMPMFHIIGAFLFCFFAYFVNKKEKINFILYRKATIELENSKSIIENLNSGFISINDKGCDYNLKIKSYLDISSNRGSLTSLIQIDQKLTLNNNESYSPLNYNFNNKNLGIKSLLFDNYLEINPALDHKMKEIFQKSKFLFSPEKNEEDINFHKDKIVLDLFQFVRLNEFPHNYLYIGDKTINGSRIIVNSSNKDHLITLRIYLRYNHVSSTLEFLLNDISSVVEEENKKACNRYKKLFLNKFSHEFKNPLLNIIQLVSDLKRKLKKNKSISRLDSLSRLSFLHTYNKIQEQFNLPFSMDASANICNSNPKMKNIKEIKYIKDSAVYLVSLVEDFGFVSNIEAYQSIPRNSIDHTKSEFRHPIDQWVIEISKFRLTKIVRQCVSILQTKIDLSEKNIKVTSSIDENIPYEIFSDYRRLKQVISNVLSNAFKFTMMGEISITVRRHPLDNNLINFEISDTGMGFRQDVLAMVQEGKTHLLFGNINSGGNIYGCGIGLELVENIISRIGSNLEIKSKTHEGSLITFSIRNCPVNKHGAAKISSFKTAKSFKSDRPVLLNNISTQNVTSNRIFNKRKNMMRRCITLKNTETKFLKLNSFQDTTIKFQKNANEIIQNEIYDRNATIDRKFSIVKITDTKEVEYKFNQDTNEELSLDVGKDLCKEILNCENEMYNENDLDTDEDNKNTLIYDGPLKIKNRYNTEYNNKEIDYDQDSSSLSKTFKLNDTLKLDRTSKNDVYLSIDNSDAKQDRSESIRFKNENLVKKPINQGPIIRILLVDDEKFIRQAQSNQIKKFFKSKPNYQYEIVECSDGVECLYNIYKGIQENIKYDYIITDESMNFMRGTVMIKALNALIEENIMYGIKRFIVTSYEPWAIINTHGNTTDGIISKPLTFENIKTIFEKI